MALGKKLSFLRKRHNMSQLDLAEALDVSRQAISKWECGTAAPSTENLIAIGKLYGVSVDALVNDELSVEDVMRASVSASAVAEFPPEGQGRDEPQPVRKTFPIGLVLAAGILLLAILTFIGLYLLNAKFDEQFKDDAIPIEEMEEEEVDNSVVFEYGPIEPLQP